MNILKNIDSTIALSIITGGSFLVGWVYTKEFYIYFGINHTELQYGMYDYLINSIPALTACLVIGVIYFLIGINDEPRKSYYIFCYTAIMTILITCYLFESIFYKILVIILFVLSILFVLKTHKKFLHKYDENNSKKLFFFSIPSRIMFIAVTFTLLLIFSKEIAVKNAEGILYGNSAILASFKNYKNVSDEIKSKDYILVVYCNEKYFVTRSELKYTIVIPEEKDQIVIRWKKR